MNAPLVIQPLTRPVPSFSRSRALSWLGHDCDTQCAAGIGRLRVELWFIRRAEKPLTIPRGAVLLLDADGSDEAAERIRPMIGAVNRCGRADGIFLRERRLGDNGPALATVMRAALQGRDFPFRLAGHGITDPAGTHVPAIPLVARSVAKTPSLTVNSGRPPGQPEGDRQ